MHPTKTLAAATRLRRPSTALPQARSSSFSGHTSISQNTLQPRTRSTNIYLHHKSTSTTTNPNTTLILTWPRSTWLSHPRPNTIFGFRLSSTFHDSKCRWIRSSDGPHASPRDKECPACQEAEKRPEQLSRQELWWERRMHRFKEVVDRDPYDAMFGWSNDMLKGRPLKPRWYWDDVAERGGRGMWSLRAIREEAAKNNERWRSQIASRGRAAEGLEQDVSKPAASPPKHAQPLNKKVKVEASKSEEKPIKKSQPQLDIQGYNQWGYQSTDSAGKSIEPSRPSTYDPISGRMVPVKQEIQPEEAAPKSLPPKAPSEKVVKKTETVSETQKYEIKEKLEFMAWLREHPEKLEEAMEAARSHDVQPAQQPKNSVPAQADEAKERGQLYRETERSLIIAQESIRAMIATDPARHQVAVRAEDQARALKATPLGKTLLCLQNTQLSLESYSAFVNALARFRHESNAEDVAASDMIDKKRKLESSWRSDEKRPASARNPHFKQRDSKYPSKDYAADAAARQAYESLHRHRHAPLKCMNSHELHNHRCLLLRSWNKQHPRSQPSQTEAQKCLSQEVDAQKNVYAAWENRWSRKIPVTPAPAPPSPAKSAQSASDLAPQQAAPVIAAEGDMCPNVVKFCNAERVYKRKAPHAMTDDDPTLVQKIKSIYEETYGTIDSHHRQRRLDQEVFDTTRSSLWRGSATSSTHNRDAPAMEYAHPPAATQTISRLFTSLQRHQSSQRSSQDASSSASRSTPTSEVGSASTSQPAAHLSPYVVVEYNESKLSSHMRPVASHPDGWSSPRSSPNTIMENLRSKMGYSSVLIPQIQKLREQGYVLWDLARDDKCIIFKLQTQRPCLVFPNTELSGAISPATSSIMQPGAISASSNLAKKPTTNPIDPSLRSPPQTQTGNFASPTGFVNLDRPDGSVAPQSRSHNAAAASADKSTRTTMFEMLDDHASQSANHTPEQQHQQCKQLHQKLRQQQQQEQQAARPASARSKNKVKRQERVYSGGQHENRSRKTFGDNMLELLAKILAFSIFICAAFAVTKLISDGLNYCFQLQPEAEVPVDEKHAQIQNLKPAALKIAEDKAWAESRDLHEKQHELQLRFDAELARLQDLDAAAHKTAAEINAEPRTSPETNRTAAYKAVEMDAEPKIGRVEDPIQAWLNQKFSEAEAELAQVQSNRAARRKALAEAKFETGMSRAGSDSRAASVMWQESKTSREGAQTRESMEKAELKHPVAVAFVEAATLSLSLGAVGWIFLKMLEG